MKAFLFFLIGLFVFFDASAQTYNQPENAQVDGARSDSVYQVLIAKASLLHLQENFRSAIVLYEQAFQIQKPNALTAYKAAGMYALNGNADQAFRYLYDALASGWTEADWLAVDPYYNYLRKAFPSKWSAILKKARQTEQQAVLKLKRPLLRKEINLMTLQDQRLRYKRAQTKEVSSLKIIDHQINRSDLENLKRAKEIIKKFGWLKISEVGLDGQNNFWLIVQHADQNVRFQQAALQAMMKLKGTNEINAENFAFLYDRVQCNLNYKQLYGTQVVWKGSSGAA